MGHIDFASSSEDEFPDLDVIFQRSKQIAPVTQKTTSERREPSNQTRDTQSSTRTTARKETEAKGQHKLPGSTTGRRRILGQQLDNPLLKPLASTRENEGRSLLALPLKTRGLPDVRARELRGQNRPTPPVIPPAQDANEDEDSTHEATEITEADISEFFGESASESEGNDDNALMLGRPEPATASRRPQARDPEDASKKRDRPSVARRTPELDLPGSRPRGGGKSRERTASGEGTADKTLGRNTTRPTSTIFGLTDEVADALRRLDLTTKDTKNQHKKHEDAPRVTPPSTPPRISNKTLTSPKKLPAIPQTPHGPGMDLFWDQEFVDEWNEEHSPKKLVLPPAQKSPIKSTAKPKPSKSEGAKQKETKKAFEQRKHNVAQSFLHELDDTITQGKLQSLAESTGGIKINWSTKLNTTAGRANWRRETVRTKLADGTEKSVTHRHHASIELAEKVIDDEHRLLNVVAHEFCHLANFMVNGITGNPHGKEFKAWAAQCSLAFGDRGIEVTTKHSYEIDFKYVWECTECMLEYKRHSKSINPERHRCGACKGLLKQIKPVPRAAAKPSEYQLFLKEQMKVVKEEYPKSPQKEVMKIIADRWAKRGSSNRTTPESDQSTPVPEASIGKVGARLGNIKL